ncbi:MAG: flagellar export chaperone FlgN [Planctomycetota bacterium]
MTMRARQSQDLLAGLRRQREIYRVLVQLTEEQFVILGRGETAPLIGLIQAKEAELARVEAIDAEIGALKEGWREWRDEVADELRANVDAELASLSRVLKQLLDLEAAGETALQKGMAARTQVLRQIEGARKVQQAYGGAQAPTPPRLLDRSQ